VNLSAKFLLSRLVLTSFKQPDNDLLWLPHNLLCKLVYAAMTCISPAMQVIVTALKQVTVKPAKQNAPPCWWGVLLYRSLTMTYFHIRTYTIIGAESFHCPVRDGKEWDQLAMVVRHN
jgi:hypothetical protein